MLPVQSRMARAAVGWGVRDLAAAAKVSPDTIARLERGESLYPRTVEAIRAALEAMGVEFTNGEAPGVRLRYVVLAMWDQEAVALPFDQRGPANKREWFLTLERALERARERWPEIRSLGPQIIDREQKVLRSTRSLEEEFNRQ